jgi:hypothetical protein
MSKATSVHGPVLHLVLVINNINYMKLFIVLYHTEVIKS